MKKRVIYSELENYDEDEYEWLKDLCFYHNGVYLASGYFGSWCGKQQGGKVCDDLLNCLNAIRPDRGWNESEIYYENRELFVENHHHDGSSKVVIKQLTKKGIIWYSNNCYRLSRRETIEHLLNTKGYTKNVKLGL